MKYIMEIDEIIISKAIISRFMTELQEYLDIDVAIAGAGPAGMVAAYYLAKKGKKVAIYERRTSIGGGMWAGGMMFNQIVIQSDAKSILEEFGIRAVPYQEGYYTIDAIESTSALAYHAVHAGAKIFNLMAVEDLFIHRDRVSGFVINWSTTSMNQLLIDPLTIRAKYSVDATGHDAQIVAKLVKKNNFKLNTPSGQIVGERGMWADLAERDVVANTSEVYPGLYVAGMACAAVFGTPRMGPIFGGMLMSGKKLAEELLYRLK